MAATQNLLPLVPYPVGATLLEVTDVARQQAPYLAKLLTRHQSHLDLSSTDALAEQCEAEIANVAGLSEALVAPFELERALRKAKQRVHLVLALLDLSCAWSQARVTDALTRFADAALDASLAVACGLHGVGRDGFFIFAFGKMGAYELNYSSDIDLAVFFDPDRFQGGRRGPQDTAIRIVREVCRLMETQTEEGYVFRTDLRLRPDPGATPAAVSTRRAGNYYREIGQNWERMAWIKARPCVGDLPAAHAFQADLSPFVWRRRLDYWTIADVHAIKRMINARVGDTELGVVDCDVKLGPGGIREIEFFAQTQQVILGGRDDTLRAPGTLDALAALAVGGCIPSEQAQKLSAAYAGLRAVEHRIQMLQDVQTHTLPSDDARRAQVSRLMGFDSLELFDGAVLHARKTVQDIYGTLFADDANEGAERRQGNFVFTGVDDDPATVATLQKMGFSNPERVIAAFRRWHVGYVPATRTERGRALLTTLTPRLLEAMSSTGEPSMAFAHFERFFEALNAGVQLLSMLDAEEDLLEDLVSSLAVAPRLARILAQRPALLESLVTRQSTEPFSVSSGATFGDAIDAARRYHRDRVFLIGHALLNGRLAARDAAKAWSDLARELVSAMAKVAAAETADKFGDAPGRWTIMAMGSFGGNELTAGSDLDMIVLYDPETDGAATRWFTRFTQRLTTALSAPTAEGVLYEVDMRLRPSGRAGPVAVRLSAFQRYHNADAWTWEHMALTRMSPVAGDDALASQAQEIASRAIDARRSTPSIADDVDQMRERLKQEKPAAGIWDLKHSDGGLVDIEFFVQKRLLLSGGPGAIVPNTHDALERLKRAGQIDGLRANRLQEAWTFLSALRQILALALDGAPDPKLFSTGLEARLCRAVKLKSFEDVSDRLQHHYEVVMQNF
ncbi:MAG: bifunctional [glutamine synthetase] adenylyltransferase/[glutamine synthetase]-adenylyl-L-tyrosine phosphorylase [Pseudomonadota bacterium]